MMTVRGFFDALFSDCAYNVNLRAIDPARKRPVEEAFVQGTDAILQFATQHVENYHVYFGVATRNGVGTKEGICEVVALHVDVDFKDTPRDKALALLNSFPVPPTFVVETGGGFHVYWRLKGPVGKMAIPRVEAINRGLARNLGGDLNACDASRILRVPGTVNHKYASLPTVTVTESHPHLLGGEHAPSRDVSSGDPRGAP